MGYDEFREQLIAAFYIANRLHGYSWTGIDWDGLREAYTKIYSPEMDRPWIAFTEVPPEAREPLLVAFKLAFN
jgi:hypothetical protein